MAAQQLLFNINFNDASVTGTVISPTEFVEQFLWGIPLCNPITGTTIGNAAIQSKLNAAQAHIENLLDVKLLRQLVVEQLAFTRSEFFVWGYLKCSYLLNKVFSLTGNLNTQAVIFYPEQWLTIRRKYPKDFDMQRNFYIVPSGQGASVTFDFLATINNQWFSFYGAQQIPNYWWITYLTGYNTVPADIINLMGIYACILLLPIIEAAVNAGGNPSLFGAASNSLSLDGLSQNTAKVNGGNIFKERLNFYTKQYEIELKQLKNMYSGIIFDVC